MSIQYIEQLLASFQKTSGEVKDQLVKILADVTNGKVPSEDYMATFSLSMAQLREKYDSIYSTTMEMVSEKELPPKGKGVLRYVEAAKNSKFRLMKSQMDSARQLLEKFISVRSDKERYALKLKPYQEKAERLMAQISENTIEELLPKIEENRLFISAINNKDLNDSDEGEELINKLGKYYPIEIVVGLSGGFYFLEDDGENVQPEADSREVSEEKNDASEVTEAVVDKKSEADSSSDKEDSKADVTEAEKDTKAVEETPVKAEESKADSAAEAEKDTKAVEETPVKAEERKAVSVAEAEKDTKAVEEAPVEAEESKAADTDSKSNVKVVNSPKKGMPSTSAFKKEMVRLSDMQKAAANIIPLLSNLGVLTIEQCFGFARCMGIALYTNKNIEHFKNAMDTFVLKGYVACLEYDVEGEKKRAYCLSEYCRNGLNKASIKGIFNISTGRNSFDYNVDNVVKEVATNELLLNYASFAMKTLSKRTYNNIMESISRKDKYYTVNVNENGLIYKCYFVGVGERADNIQYPNILICEDKGIEYSAEDFDNNNVFVFKDNQLYHIKSTAVDKPVAKGAAVLNKVREEQENASENKVATENTATEPVVTENVPVEETATEPVATESVSVEETATENTASEDVVEEDKVMEAISTEESSDSQEAAACVEEELSQEEITPQSLLKRKKTPTDDEFYKVICDIINKEYTTKEQLKANIVNGALLAKSAGLCADCDKTKEFSLQFNLATNVFTEDDAYTSDKFIAAFSDINEENGVMALAAYMFAMLSPSLPFDYLIRNKTEEIFADFDIYFGEYSVFKPLFNKLMEVKKVYAKGFSDATIALLTDAKKSSDYVAELKKQAEENLTVPMYKIRKRIIPLFYTECFGENSIIYEALHIVSENKTEELEYVKEIMEEFCRCADGSYALDLNKVEDYIIGAWDKHSTDNKGIIPDVYNHALNYIKKRIGIIKSWVELTSSVNIDKEDLNKLHGLKTELLEAIRNTIESVDLWKNKKNSVVLIWALDYMQSYLSGNLRRMDLYSELLLTGVISLDESGVPIIDESLNEIKLYEPWRNALRHITARKKTFEEIKAEIRGDILQETDEEEGLKDNLNQLRLIGIYLNDKSDEYDISSEDILAAEESANERTTRFKEVLELAYTYNRINETEKENISCIVQQYQKFFYEIKDFANWRRFLEALEAQVDEFSAGRKKVLRARLNEKLKEKPDSPILKEADKLLEEDENYAVTEEYITRFENGENEVEESLEVLLQDRDYFAEFLDPDNFKELYDLCSKGKGRYLGQFAADYLEKKMPRDWQNKNKEDSRKMIRSWIARKDHANEYDVKELFRCIGFKVETVRKVNIARSHFHVTVTPTEKSMADYRHPIAAFGTQVRNPLDVILVDAHCSTRQLVDTITSYDLGGIAIVIYNQPMDIASRRQMAELFHTQTSGQNSFLLLDQVLFLYLAMHQETERMPAFMMCTLPYAAYQPFVRDGGPTADEMFFGRARELATIMDLNGATIVYGGRQLGKTALLERAQSRCSNPIKKQYAVYSNIIDISNEAELVEKLIEDIERKTNCKIRLKRCESLKEMCKQLSNMFIKKEIEVMYLFIDEADTFLASIAEDRYDPIKPLVELKRETKNSFKFVLTGLHNVCRAKNATTQNGVFGQFGTPLCIKPLSPTDALKLLSRPLSYLGFQINRYPHLETILTNTNYYPGILQFFGYMLVENLTGQYSAYYSAADGAPPFKLQDEQLGAVMNSSDLNTSIKDKFRLSLELDKRYFMIARCVTMLYHYYEEDRSLGSWKGFTLDDILEIARSYEIHCLENESEEDFVSLLEEMIEMGILSQPTPGYYRLRRSSFVDIIGENIDNLEKDIIANNEVIP